MNFRRSKSNFRGEDPPRAGGKLLHALVPGDPEASALSQAIRHADDYEPMPSKRPKLANNFIKNFESTASVRATSVPIISKFELAYH